MKSFAETCQILIYDAKLYQNSVMDDGIKIFCQEGVNMNLLFCPCCQSVCQSFHKNSHIISEFLHDGCYSENQNALVLDFRNDKPDMKKKGFKGSFICEKCEGEFSKYETYASQVLTKKSPHSKIHNSVARRKYVTRGLKFEKWIGLDFKKMQRLGV